jgi:hypothetical protein
MVDWRIDWITITVRDWRNQESIAPVLIGELMAGTVVPGRHPSGARGWYGRSCFIGCWDNGMLIYQASGSWAHAIARKLDRLLPETGRSVARIDVQATLAVHDADAIIRTTVPNRRYKSTLIQSVYESGATLYVGAPSSDARLRLYNKSAESGEYPSDGGEWLRAELQLRNRYADRMYAAYLGGAVGGTALEFVRRMGDNNLYRLLRDNTSDAADAPYWDEDSDLDWVGRRIHWLVHCVVPALRKLVLHDPETRREVGLALARIMDYNPGNEHESDSRVQRSEL